MSNGKQKVVHVKQFDGGRSTPAEYYRKAMYAGQKCSTCGDPPAMRARFLAPMDEFRKKYPRELAQLILMLGGQDPGFETTYGRMVHVQSLFACDKCKTSLRRMAAKKEDWFLVEFEELGLEESHPLVVAVPR